MDRTKGSSYCYSSYTSSYFCTQFRTLTRRTNSTDTRRGLTGAEVAGNELRRQQVIDQTYRGEENGTQDVSVVQGARRFLYT